MIRHTNAHVTVNQFKCLRYHCNNLFPEWDLLVDHQQKMHKLNGLRRVYECYICHKQIHNKNDLLRHKKNHFDGKINDDGKRKRPPKRIARKIMIIKKPKTVKVVIQSECPFCNELVDEIRRHTRTYHEKEMFVRTPFKLTAQPEIRSNLCRDRRC